MSLPPRPSILANGTLHTEHLLMRVGPADAAARMVQYFHDNEEHLRPWSPAPSPRYYSADFWQSAFEADRHDFSERRSARFVLFERGDLDGPIVGQCNFSEVIGGIFQACYLGYALDHRFVGKGYMSEALRAGIAFMFNTFGLHRIMANYMPSNERSGALLRRFGFEVEGFARAYLYINGAWQDHVLTALANPNPREPLV